jgi:hypothetical protein
LATKEETGGYTGIAIAPRNEAEATAQSTNA